ncbi:MAG: retron system putative HNH endonuclease [Nannocystaceae bacterium]
MRTIRKGKEPAAWARFRATPDARFGSTDAPKEELRRALVAEQHGLCCYCMGRIRPRPDEMKIEHWSAQSEHPEQQLDYGNLLGACPGGRGHRPRDQHCDTAKGNRELHINPADPRSDCTPRFSYLRTGEVRPSADDRRVAEDITTLNLNVARLRAGRRERIASVLHEVVRSKRSRSKHELERMAARFEQPDELGNLEPFCQAAIFWLRRQARQRPSSS